MSSLTQLVTDSPFAALFLDLLLKSVVILAVAAGVSLCWRRAAASTRHLVWFLAVLGLLCLPGLAHLLPGWQRPLWAIGTRADSLNELTLTLDLAPASGLSAASQPTPPLREATPVSGAAQAGGGQGFRTHFQRSWAASVIAVWLVGAVVILASAVAGRWRLRGVRQAAHALVAADWSALLQGLREELRIRRRVALLQSDEDVMPVTWGWWKPVILLPAEAGGWSAERRRIVLMHELAHIKRWDCLTQMIGQLAAAIYWFNPLIWLATRRMCVERECACDDLVLNGGCKASDYAFHLVELARSFRRLPQVAAIAMARSSQLGGRVAAIVDASRVRRTPRAWWLGCWVVAVLGMVAAVAAQKPQTEASPLATKPGARPWFDQRLRAFFVAKAAQARQLAAKEPGAVAPEVWPYFAAGSNGDWQTATNLWAAMRERAHQYGKSTPDARLDPVWGPILETELAWEQFANWKKKYVLAYGNDIIKSIPSGSIYFGGTDPGRGVITALSASHAEGKPCFTLTQNALADATYLAYLRAMYGPTIYTPTGEDAKTAFQEYLQDAQRRLAEGKLKPGEDVQTKDNRVQVSGQVAVMNINGLLTKIIFDHNPEREFFVEESFPLDWMYPHLTPNGLIMRVNREPLSELPEETVRKDQDYWSRYLRPMLGGWLKADTSVAEIAAFLEKVYLQHDLRGFKGDPEFIQDEWAQKGFSKLRSAIGGVYNWRLNNAKTAEEKGRMAKAADFAFRQAFALCPSSPEAVFRYVQLLVQFNRFDDAIIVAETCHKLDAHNDPVVGLLESLRGMKSRQTKRGNASQDLKGPEGAGQPRP